MLSRNRIPLVFGATRLLGLNFLFTPRPIDAMRRMQISAQIQINTFQGALGQYRVDTGSFPSSAQDLAVLRKDPGTKGWNGPHLSQEIPLDPWTRPYLYNYPGEHGDEPDILSLGADGQRGGKGPVADIAGWKSN